MINLTNKCNENLIKKYTRTLLSWHTYLLSLLTVILSLFYCQLALEYGIKFMETSAKANINVENVSSHFSAIIHSQLKVLLLRVGPLVIVVCMFNKNRV